MNVTPIQLATRTPLLQSKSSLVIDQVFRLPQIKVITGLSKSSIYAGVKNGTFPAPVKLAKRSSGWRASSLQVWLESRKPSNIKEAA